MITSAYRYSLDVGSVNTRPIMVQIANLVLGLEVEDLLVEVTKVEGMKAF